MPPTLKVFWYAPGYIILYLLLVVALGFFINRILYLLSLVRQGNKDDRFDQLGKRTGLFLSRVAAQWCTLRSFSPKDLSGIGHFVLFWTFVLFFVNYAYLFIWGAWHEQTSLMELSDSFSRGFSAVLEILALLTIGAIIWALARRYIARPKRLDRGLEPAFILLLVFLLMASHFVSEALRISLGASGGPVSSILTSVFAGMNRGAQQVSYYAVWWLHIVVFLSFLVYIPYSKHLHILVSPFTTYFKTLRPMGVIEPIDIEKAETLGVGQFQEFSWKHLLDLYACAKCGWCQVSCPAYLSGKSLTPKGVIQDLGDYLLGRGGVKANSDLSLSTDVVSEEKNWACTTCGACQQICPVSIEHVNKFIELRRNLVMVKNRVPEAAQRALGTLIKRGDPWTGALHLRTDWIEGLELKKLSENSNVDILFWVGCTGAMDERNMKSTIALAKLMKQAGVNFGILAAEESCCGDPARRLGQELIFQAQALRNIETLNRYHVKKIVASCPHCYNTLSHEYPQFGGNFEVMHHTELIARLIDSGRLKQATRRDKRVTYHDPCYLARYNDIWQAPRKALSATLGAKLIELERRKRETFCCGGGGGHMWLEEEPDKRVNMLRIEEVIKAKADIVATACPYCLQMLEDAIKRKDLTQSIAAMDIAELVQIQQEKTA